MNDNNEYEYTRKLIYQREFFEGYYSNLVWPVGQQISGIDIVWTLASH